MIAATRLCALAFALAAACAPAAATWSIIVVDTATGEIAIGSATCLTSFDLARGLPVLRVGVGAAAAQSVVDSTGVNRRRIWDELALGTAPEQIVQLLATGDGNYQRRQYGIVDLQGRAATFTGSLCGAYANGLTGQFGTLVYAIQGNVITGQPVLAQSEAALRDTPGALPERLMAAMEAARAMGGDGRCSCSASAPASCGSPPPSFTKSAHIGFMIVSRRGDTDGVCNASVGCVNGNYYMYFNIANQLASAPDPVIQLRQRFDTWRAENIGVPDAIESAISVSPASLINDGQSTATLRIELRDWQGSPVASPIGLAALHDPAGSGGICSIGPLVDRGGGVFEATVSAGTTAGLDRFAATFQAGTATRYIMPSATLRISDGRGDLNGDGRVDLNDLTQLLSGFGVSAAGDVDQDGDTDLRDLALWLSYL